jgi:hypothetical protein
MEVAISHPAEAHIAEALQKEATVVLGAHTLATVAVSRTIRARVALARL